MTNTALPIDASSGSPAYTAQQFRQAMSSLVANGTSRPVGGRSGYAVGHQPTTLTVTSTTWTIGPFSAVVDPAFTTTQGAYFISSDANNTNTNVTAAPSSPNSRIDILYAQVNDTAIDSSGARNFTVNYLAGTAGTSPSAPALPARSVLLATINVASSPATPTITLSNIFTAAAGGVVPVATAAGLIAGTTITNPYEGMPAYAMDTNTPYMYDGATWQPQIAGQLLGKTVGPGTPAVTMPTTGASYVATSSTLTLTLATRRTLRVATSVFVHQVGATNGYYRSTPSYNTGSYNPGSAVAIDNGDASTGSGTGLFTSVKSEGTVQLNAGTYTFYPVVSRVVGGNAADEAILGSVWVYDAGPA